MKDERHEKIEDIVGDIRAQNQGLPEDSYALSPLVCDLLSLADRIEAAAKREREAGAAAHQLEVAELRECLKEAVKEVCNRLEKCGFKAPCVFKTCYVQKWRKALRKEGGAK